MLCPLSVQRYRFRIYMVIDPSRGDHSVGSAKVNSQCVEMIDGFKYLGLLLGSKLSFAQRVSQTQSCHLHSMLVKLKAVICTVC